MHYARRVQVWNGELCGMIEKQMQSTKERI